MQKVRQRWQIEYNPLRLFKEDIEKIIEIIKTVLETEDSKKKNYQLKIVADEFEIDGAHELSEIKKEVINRFSIRLNYDLNLTIRNRDAVIEVADSENSELRGIASKIDDILKNKQRPIVKFFKSNVFFAICYLPIPLSFFFLGINPIIIFFFLSLSLLFFLMHFLTWTQCFTKIYMCYSSEKASFFKRNKDSILTNLIGVIIGMVLGIFGTILILWIKNYFNIPE